jgi:type VI secretion system protein ImpC
LKIQLVQITKDELLQDLLSSAELEDSGLAALLVAPGEVPGGVAPAMMIGLYEFTHDLEDLAVLERMGNLGRKLRAPFVASASAALLGASSLAEITKARELEERFHHSAYRPWQLLRKSSAGRWLALALPRLLTRLPYGHETNPAESFELEERIGADDHEKLLWGNPAFAVGAVVAGAFAGEGWDLDLARGIARLQGLPLYYYVHDGETVAKPCAEVLFNEQTLEVLEQAGLLPLVSYREQDTVALPCVQSIAEPRAPLAFA